MGIQAIESQSIVLVIFLFIAFILFIVGSAYIIIRVSYELKWTIEVEQLDFLNWVRQNCRLKNGEWYYDQEPESSEKLLEIYNNQKDE